MVKKTEQARGKDESTDGVSEQSGTDAPLDTLVRKTLSQPSKVCPSQNLSRSSSPEASLPT